MDKLLASSRTNTSSVDYKQKAKETTKSEEAKETAKNSEIEENSKTIKSIVEKQKEEQEKNKWESFLEQTKMGRQRAAMAKALDYSPSKDLIKIATASNSSAVNNIAAQIRIKMGKVRRSGGKPEQISFILGQMSGVIGKARIKASKLNQEMQIERSRELARYKKNELEEEKLERDLNRKKRNRVSQENNDILEAKSKELANLNNCFGGWYNTSGEDTKVPITSPIPAQPTTIDTVSALEVGIGSNTSTVDFTL